QNLSLNPMVSTTNVSPSQLPMESPYQEGSGSVRCLRPSVKICRKVWILPSNKKKVWVAVCTILQGYGAMRGTPVGRQFASGSSFDMRSAVSFSAHGCKGSFSPGLSEVSML